MPHPNTFAKNGLAKPKNPLGEFSPQMSRSRSSSLRSSLPLPSPAKSTFKTNQNTATLQHQKSVTQTKVLDFHPSEPKKAGKRSLKSREDEDDRKASKRHKIDSYDSQRPALMKLLKVRQEQRDAQNAYYAKSKGQIVSSEPIPLGVIPPKGRVTNAEPSSKKPVKSITTNTTGTQTELLTAATVKTNTDDNGSIDTDSHRHILRDSFRMLMKQFEIYALKHYEDRGVTHEEINQHLSNLIQAFKLAHNESCLMAQIIWDFMVTIEGGREIQKFLLQKCKETIINSANIMEFFKAHREDDLWGQVPCTLDSPLSFASSAAEATRPVIIKQDPDEEPIDQQDWTFNDGKLLPHDFIPAVPIKEERMNGILTDHQHVSAIISFNAM